MSKRKINRYTEPPYRLLDAPEAALRDILVELETQHTDGWGDFYKQLEGRDLPDLSQMSLAIAMRVFELSQRDPEEAIKYFRDQQIMPFPRFLPKSELSRFGDFFQQIMEELEWGKGVKEVRGDTGKLLYVHLYNIWHLFDELRGVVPEKPRYIPYFEHPIAYDDTLLESIKQLPDLDKDSVGNWAIVIRDWILAIEQQPSEERFWVSPDPDDGGYIEPMFPYHENTYCLFINEIKKGLEKETEEEIAKRTETHDKIEKKAVKNLAEHYNVEMKDGFPKEWEDLTDYDDFREGKKWGDYAWVYQEYQKLKGQRQKSLDEAKQSAKKTLLHDKIRKRLAEMVG